MLEVFTNVVEICQESRNLSTSKNLSGSAFCQGSQKKAELYADFKFVHASFKKCSYKKLKANNYEKCEKTKMLKIRIDFWL
jgi:hypothetical protein